jgi:cytochrome c553
MTTGDGTNWQHEARLRRPMAPVAPVLGMLLLALSAAPAHADPAKLEAYGRHLVQECATCHRLDGADNGIPSIIGWDAESLKVTLGFYKLGERTNPAMVSVAQSLDDQQIEAIAAFLSKVPKPRPRQAR